MPFHHEITDAVVATRSASCSPACVSAIVGEPVSRIELC
jgi:hypothetical protein